VLHAIHLAVTEHRLQGQHPVVQVVSIITGMDGMTVRRACGQGTSPARGANG
jgi:hypothetical protein